MKNNTLKRMIFIYPNSFIPVTGGQIYESNLIKGLQKNHSFKVDVLFQNSGSLLKKFLSPIINIRLYKKLNGMNLIAFNSTKGFYYIPLQFFIRKLSKSKTLVIHHHFLYKEFRGIKRILYKWMEKTFIKGATYVLTPSPYIFELLKTEYGVNPILNEIPFERPDVFIGKNKVKNRLLYVGTIEPRKGLTYLCESLKRVKDEISNYELHIVGKVKNQKYFENLKSFIDENKLNVKFYGYVTDDELKELYSSAEVFVFPSLLEGFGMAINEAMSYGLPVIAFNNSAMPYSINEKNGILVENKNSEKFGDAILSILKDSMQREYLNKGALRWAQSLPTMEYFENNTTELFYKL